MAERLNRSLLYTFGVGDLCFTLLVSMELYFFPAFLTNYAQFSMFLVTGILWITGLADIVCSLVGGVILQRASLRFGGKYRSWLLIGPPIVAPLFILQFTKIGSDSIAALIIIAGFIVSHLFWNVVFAATGSLVGTLSQLPDERTIMSSSRAQGMSAAGLIFSATALPMITFFAARAGNIIGYSITIAVYGILMILGYLYIYKITAGKGVPEDASTAASNKGTGHSILEIVGLVFKNTPLLMLIFAETFRNTSIFVISAFAFYYFEYVLKNPAFLSVFILAISVVALFGTFVAAWIGIKIGKRNTYWISLVAAALCFVLANFLEKTAWSFTATFCVAYMLAMLAGAMNTALFADTVVYGEWKTGKNIQAFTMALLVLPIKVGVLLRSAVVTIGLMAIGFVANSVPAPGVVSGINSIMIFSPAAACAIAAVAFYFGYRIEDKQVLQMQDEIAAKGTVP